MSRFPNLPGLVTSQGGVVLGMRRNPFLRNMKPSICYCSVSFPHSDVTNKPSA